MKYLIILEADLNPGTPNHVHAVLSNPASRNYIEKVIPEDQWSEELRDIIKAG